MKIYKIVFLTGMAIFVVFGILWIKRFFQIDSCLDKGGKWNYELKKCEGCDDLDSFVAIDSLNRLYSGEVIAKQELDKFLEDSTANLLRKEILIKDKRKLISVVEPILFDVYGKQKILEERPYEIYLFGDYWIMMGTLPNGMKGGTFTIVINRRTCEVKGISHGK
jgi:hypothetical protein